MEKPRRRARFAIPHAVHQRMETPKRRRAGRPSWTDVKHGLAEELRPGPGSAEDLGQWPMTVAESLTSAGLPNDNESKVRIESWLRRVIVVYADYSGIDCPKEAMDLGLVGLQRLHGWDFGEGSHPPLRLAHSCDCDPLPQ